MPTSGASEDMTGLCVSSPLYYRTGAPEAVEYQRDSPRGPLFPPATAAQVDEAGRRLGYTLPPIFRRLVTEVADGPPQDSHGRSMARADSLLGDTGSMEGLGVAATSGCAKELVDEFGGEAS